MKIIEYSTKNPVKVAVGSIFVLLIGLLSLFRITVQLVPDVEKPQITVVTRWIGASPVEVEQEIIEDQKQRIVIQNFGYKKIPTKKLIQRQLYLIADMFDNLEDSVVEELKDNFEQLRRFYFILVTHIRTYLRTGIYVSEDTDFTPLEAMDYRMFCEKIEEIGKILREFNISEGVREYYIEIRQYFNEVMNAYLKKDLSVAHKAWLKKDKIVEIANKLKDSLEYNDKIKIKDLIRIAENCKDMAAFI